MAKTVGDINLSNLSTELLEDRFLFLISITGSNLESSKSGIEEVIKKQIDSLRDLLTNTKNNIFHPLLPKIVTDLKFRLKLISIFSNEFLITKSPQLISRRDEIAKSLLYLIRIILLADFDMATWRQCVHVFGVLVSSDSDRFYMMTPPYQKSDRPPFKKALSEILNSLISESVSFPIELKTRVEHSMPSLSSPAFKVPIKLSDLSSATVDTIDPWILLEEQPEPVLMSKIEKGEKTLPKQELTFAKTLFQQKTCTIPSLCYFLYLYMYLIHLCASIQNYCLSGVLNSYLQGFHFITMVYIHFI